VSRVQDHRCDLVGDLFDPVVSGPKRNPVDADHLDTDHLDTAQPNQQLTNTYRVNYQMFDITNSKCHNAPWPRTTPWETGFAMRVLLSRYCRGKQPGEPDYWAHIYETTKRTVR